MRLLQAALIEAQLAVVERGDAGADHLAGAAGHLLGAPVVLDRGLPLADVEGVHGHVVEHPHLHLEEAELFEDRQRELEELACRAAALGLGDRPDPVRVRERLPVVERHAPLLPPARP